MTVHTQSMPMADETHGLVLIAEDEPEIADILRAYLTRSG
ncbi:DNA-binding response regulator, partial [Dickeya dadantii]|nr:DNA-binding response regulator [Dickeya dadantii]